MAINLSDNILSKTTAPVDAKYGPYTGANLSAAISAATASLLASYRYEGLTVGLIVGANPVVEYWFNGGVSDTNLVLKTSTGGSIGATGATGSAGTSGTSGTSGFGTSGTSGTTGTSGTSGTSGTAGTSGTGFNTITNAVLNRILTSDGGSNTANAEQNLTFNGSTLAVTGDVTVSGNLTISGTATTVNTQNLTVRDSIILLAATQSGNPTLDSGFMINRGTGATQAFIWDESEKSFVLISTNNSSSDSVISNTGFSNFIVGGVTVTGTQSVQNTLARAVTINNILAATANNDTLVALDISPTFSNGGFTVSNIALRTTNGSAFFQQGPSNSVTISQGTLGIVSTFSNQVIIRNPNFANGRLNINIGDNHQFSFLDVDGYGINSSSTSLNLNSRSTTGRIQIWSQASNTMILGLGGQDINPTVARTRTSITPVGSSGVNAATFSPTAGVAIDYSFETQGNSQFGPTSGNATYTQIQLRPTINATGSYSGIVTGLYYNPILTSMTGVTHRAIETVTGDIYLASSSGNVGIGIGPSSSAKLAVSGTISTTGFRMTTGATTGYVLTSDANGNASWALSSGGGSVSLNGNINNRIVTMTGTASTLDGEANLTFDGNNLVLSGSYDFISDPTTNTYLSSDNTSHGDILNFGNTTTVAGEIYYLNTGGTWSRAQADVLVNGGNDLLAIACGTNSTTNGMLIRGFFRSSLFTSGNPGEPLFLSTTAGRTTNTAPSSSGNIVRVIGYVVGNLTDRRVYFNPSQDWIEL